MWDVYSIEDVTTSTTATTVPTTSTTKTRTTKTRTTATKSTTTKTITTKTTTTTVVVRCGPGEYRYAYRNVCRECGYRQFQSEDDHTFEACHKWSGCDSHEYEFEKPNRTHNTLCASHSDCAAGVEYESRPPRPGKSDRQVRQEAAGRLLVITSAMHALRCVAYPLVNASGALPSTLWYAIYMLAMTSHNHSGKSWLILQCMTCAWH